MSMNLKMSSVTDTSKRPRNLSSLSIEEKKQFLNSFDYVFSDIDGVVWNLDKNITGAADGFRALKSMGKNVTFITNNSVRSVPSYMKKFRDLNLTVDMEHVWHPAKSVANYLKSIHFEGLLYVIATETFKNVLRDAGFNLIDGPTKILDESYIELAKHIFDREPVGAVIVDVDFNLSSPKILRAHNYLRNPNCLLIAGATDMLLPVAKDVTIIGPGPFIKILVDASKKNAITLGKPGKELAEMLVKHFNIKDRKRTLMIGDMLEQDVRFGKECGFQTLVVLSGGCTRAELASQSDTMLLPDYYAESVQDLVQLIADVKFLM